MSLTDETGKPRNAEPKADNKRQPETEWQWPAHVTTAPARAALCRRILQVAQARARRQGIVGEAAEECALQFLERMLQRTWQALHPPNARPAGGDVSSAGGDVSEAWLRRCADNFARNVRRHWTRVHRWEARWPDWAGPEGERQDWDCPDGDANSNPEVRLLREELLGRIHAAAQQLTPAQQFLFERYFLDDASIPSLAAATGQTPHAISQSLSNIRKRLRAILERQGLDEQVAREYIQLTSYETLRFPFPPDG